MSLERRRSLRLPVDLPVQWLRRGKQLPLRAHDINSDGLFLLTPYEVPHNYLMDLEVALPTGKITFTAVARFCGPSTWGLGIGVEIHVISPTDRYAWLRFYRTRQERAMRALPASVAQMLR